MLLIMTKPKWNDEGCYAFIINIKLPNELTFSPILCALAQYISAFTLASGKITKKAVCEPRASVWPVPQLLQRASVAVIFILPTQCVLWTFEIYSYKSAINLNSEN